MLNCGYGRGLSVLEVLDAVDRVHGTGRRRWSGTPRGRSAGAGRVERRMLETLDWRPKYADIDRSSSDALAWERKLLEAAALNASLPATELLSSGWAAPFSLRGHAAGLFGCLLSSGMNGARPPSGSSTSAPKQAILGSRARTEISPAASQPTGAIELDRSRTVISTPTSRSTASRFIARRLRARAGSHFSRDDAHNAGLATRSGCSEVIGRGADGEVRGEMMTLERVPARRHARPRDMSAVVLDSGEQSLLGQSSSAISTRSRSQGDRMVLRVSRSILGVA